MDGWDLDYYTDLFLNKVKRNPTNVECFDLAQSNRYVYWYMNAGVFVCSGRKVLSVSLVIC